MGSIPRGLTYECNFNSDINKYDIAAVGSIRSKQGVESTNPDGSKTYAAAGNYFSYGDGVDIQSSGFIEYYYNPDNFGEEPLTIQGNVIPTTAPGNNCEQVYYYPDCSTQSATAPAILPAKQEYYGHESACFSLIEQAAAPDSDPAVAYHLRRMDEKAQKVLAAFQRDTTNYQPDSIRHWISKLRTPEAALWLATIHASEGNLSQAQRVLSSAVGTHQLNLVEQAHFSAYANLLVWLSNNNVWLSDSLVENISSDLWADAQSENPHFRLLTRNLLTRQGAHFPPEYVFPTEGLGDRGSEGASLSTSKSVTVRPNPARETAIFELNLSKDAPTAELHIFDTNGRLVAGFTSVGSGSIAWDTRSAVSGLYYYRLFTDGKVIATGKIFVNH